MSSPIFPRLNSSVLSALCHFASLLCPAELVFFPPALWDLFWHSCSIFATMGLKNAGCVLILLTQLTMAASSLKQLSADFECRHRSDSSSCMHPVPNSHKLWDENYNGTAVDAIWVCSLLKPPSSIRLWLFTLVGAKCGKTLNCFHCQKIIDCFNSRFAPHVFIFLWMFLIIWFYHICYNLCYNLELFQRKGGMCFKYIIINRQVWECDYEIPFARNDFYAMETAKEIKFPVIYIC